MKSRLRQQFQFHKANVLCWPTCTAGFQWQARCGIAMAQMIDLRSVAIWLLGLGGGLHRTFAAMTSNRLLNTNISL